jgi:hypothetical protein
VLNINIKEREFWGLVYHQTMNDFEIQTRYASPELIFYLDCPYNKEYYNKNITKKTDIWY